MPAAEALCLVSPGRQAGRQAGIEQSADKQGPKMVQQRYCFAMTTALTPTLYAGRDWANRRPMSLRDEPWSGGYRMGVQSLEVGIFAWGCG
jgi:hypothetical protein